MTKTEAYIAYWGFLTLSFVTENPWAIAALLALAAMSLIGYFIIPREQQK